MRHLQGLLAAILGALSFAAQGAVVFNDGDFSAWSFESFGVNGGTATMVREVAGGNPGARLNVSTVTGGSPDQTAFGSGIKNDYSTTGALEGTPFTLELDVLAGAGSAGDGQGIALMVEQGGTVYSLGLGVTGVQLAFTRLSFNGTLNAASFTRESAAGPLTPDLSGGVTTRFGVSAGNTASVSITQYYDNVALDIVPVIEPPPPSSAASVPTLSQWALLLLAALLGMLALGRLRGASR